VEFNNETVMLFSEPRWKMPASSAAPRLQSALNLTETLPMLQCSTFSD
jgi:hypothetical protein